MSDMQKQLDRAYNFSKLLKIDSIREEIEQNLNGYTLKNVELKNGEWTCSYIGENDNHLSLTISFNNVSLLKSTNNKVERIAVNENLILSHRTIDKRENGLIYSIIEKQFAPSERFKNQIVLVDLIERRYTLTKENMETLMDNIDFDNDRLMQFLLKLRMLENKIDLKEECDYYSQFSTHMNYYVNWDGIRKIKDNIYPTRTYLNQLEISSMYDIDGPDKLYRIFDLYRGIINTRNEKDINLINLEFLSQDVYDLKGLKGITEQEDLLVGKSLEIIPQDYIEYLKQMLYDKFGYKGDLSLDRESVLSGILYKMSGPEMAKRSIEMKLGIPYSEFEKLDLHEQHRLIEEKTGKKIKPDDRLYIDEIPIDEDHIITREQVDKRLDELTSSGPRKILKRIFNRKKK